MQLQLQERREGHHTPSTLSRPTDDESGLLECGNWQRPTTLQGVGFRGKERSTERRADDFGDEPRGSGGLIRRSADPAPMALRNPMTRDGWRRETSSSRSLRDDQGSRPRLRRGKVDIKDDRDGPARRSRAARFNDPNHSFGKKSLERRQSANEEPPVQYREGGLSIRRDRADKGNDGTGGRRRPQTSSSSRRAAESDRTALERNPEGSKLSKSRLAFLARAGETSQSGDRDGPISPYSSEGSREKRHVFHRDGFNRSRPTQSEYQHSQNSRPNTDSKDTRPTFNNDRLPLSIPYTTPASEFLYGTSVVEAALRSHRSPRRKLYKLYIFAGENRENAERDAGIERLARKNGVEVVYVDVSWLRLMDKMSGGRPHNGYILEASPIPRLPITSLGELSSLTSLDGFTVVLDHQSREEATINGTSSFIAVRPHRDASVSTANRKPFVLLLDSILDPGNLGGILRTASFLGVTALAISTRNSASLTPVVLKASAGASESITLFSVSKPAGFIVDSQRAGWKVYAAVAPSSSTSSSSMSREANGTAVTTATATPQVLTTQLGDPLADAPCLLMLGNEGEGLRWNLRSKADVEVAIQGCGGGGGGSKGVDSLNVSVAAGILCEAFLKGAERGVDVASAGVKERERLVKKSMEPERDLF